MNLQTVIFIGRSGAGKGMQSGMLQEFLKKEDPETPILYIETGDHFRRHIKDSGHTWDLAREVNESGRRQPSFLAVWIWSHLFIEKIRGGEHLVFDGTPRSLDEARILSTALPFYERKEPAVIFLNVSREWAEERLRGRGRPDDLNPDVVNRRLAWYEEDVVPAVDYYRGNSAYRFFEINGEQTPAAVFDDIVKQLRISNF